MNKFKSRVLAAATTIGLCLIWASPASAHVGIAETEQTAGTSTVLTFTVGHGCGTSPTTRLEIQIPESIVNVTPARNAFYDISVETEQLTQPIESDHGDPVTSREAVVVYTAKDPLPSDQRDTIQLSMTLPADSDDTTLYFPVVQTCENGSNSWIEIPTDGSDTELESPAPFINVAAGSGEITDDHHRGEATDTAAGDDGTDDHDSQANSDSDDGDSNGLAVVALIVGALGLAVGVGGFITAARKK